ncbi:hypothetical protein B0J14DRAFT_609094 [Halenospora varia]|nr:hypothetical protein B0J14DRAFT_609094 [Halenospora varia]
MEYGTLPVGGIHRDNCGTTYEEVGQTEHTTTPLFNVVGWRDKETSPYVKRYYHAIPESLGAVHFQALTREQDNTTKPSNPKPPVIQQRVSPHLRHSSSSSPSRLSDSNESEADRRAIHNTHTRSRNSSSKRRLASSLESADSSESDSNVNISVELPCHRSNLPSNNKSSSKSMPQKAIHDNADSLEWGSRSAPITKTTGGNTMNSGEQSQRRPSIQTFELYSSTNRALFLLRKLLSARLLYLHTENGISMRRQTV